MKIILRLFNQAKFGTKADFKLHPDVNISTYLYTIKLVKLSLFSFMSLTSFSLGGIFFDDLDYIPINDAFSFVKSCGNAVIPSYTPLIKQHMNEEYTAEELEWKLLRRGR